MGKGRRWLIVAVGVLGAFAVPAVAQATITNSEGDIAGEPSALSTNTLWTTNIGGTASTFECATVRLNLKPTPAEPTHLTLNAWEAKGHKTSGLGHADPECRMGSSGLTFKVSAFIATVKLNGGGTGTVDFSHAYTITHPIIGPQHCSYSATGAAVTYTPTSSAINVAGAMTGTGGGICPTAGNIHGTFTVTSGGLPTSIH